MTDFVFCLISDRFFGRRHSNLGFSDEKTRCLSGKIRVPMRRGQLVKRRQRGNVSSQVRRDETIV